MLLKGNQIYTKTNFVSVYIFYFNAFDSGMFSKVSFTGGTSATQSSLCMRTALKECLEVILKRMLTNSLHFQRFLYCHGVGAYLRKLSDLEPHFEKLYTIR